MHSSISLISLAGLSCLSTVVSAAPFSFPSSDGFPNIANPSSQLNTIQEQAHGSLPNGTPPPSVKDDTKTSLQLVAFNELSEVAFFTQLISNITDNVKGFEVHDNSRDTLLTALNAVLAQEKLHTLNANGALVKFGGQAIQPCKYNFPVSTVDEAIALASTFTDVVLGTLQDVQTRLGTSGDTALIRGVGSTLGQEGEQNGFYRTLQHKIPSALPFLTASTREFAFSALNQLFIVPDSCPNSKSIDLPVFQPLVVETKKIEPKSQNLQFSITITDGTNNKWGSDYSGLSLVYINQQNVPIIQKVQSVRVDHNTVHFEAPFPFDQGKFGNGLTIAALTNGAGPFANANEVAKAAVFGPGLIEIN
ncbi:MAG: hypothetical protein M1813_007710 [Trichoglossum hirsutum]|nr:MAG: hypothetical protein M1813_007710 [Trichoglossum hirsutum]